MNSFLQKFPSVIPDYIKGNLSIPLNDSITFQKKIQPRRMIHSFPLKKTKSSLTTELSNKYKKHGNYCLTHHSEPALLRKQNR